MTAQKLIVIVKQEWSETLLFLFIFPFLFSSAVDPSALWIPYVGSVNKFIFLTFLSSWQPFKFMFFYHEFYTDVTSSGVHDLCYVIILRPSFSAAFENSLNK